MTFAHIRAKLARMGISVQARVGENIRRLRDRYILTQGELAILLGVTAKTVGSWEAGRHELKRRKMRAICDLFEVSPQVLRGEEKLQELTAGDEKRIRRAIQDELGRLQPPPPADEPDADES